MGADQANRAARRQEAYGALTRRCEREGCRESLAGQLPLAHVPRKTGTRGPLTAPPAKTATATANVSGLMVFQSTSRCRQGRPRSAARASSRCARAENAAIAFSSFPAPPIRGSRYSLARRLANSRPALIALALVWRWRRRVVGLGGRRRLGLRNDEILCRRRHDDYWVIAGHELRLGRRARGDGKRGAHTQAQNPCFHAGFPMTGQPVHQENAGSTVTRFHLLFCSRVGLCLDLHEPEGHVAQEKTSGRG
jgi:hypothetical protein